MAFDRDLADRVRKVLRRRLGVTEQEMFGGLAFLIHGNVGVGVRGDELIVRVAPRDAAAALKQPGVRAFDIPAHSTKGWLLIGDAGTKQPEALAEWIRRGVAYATSLRDA